MRIRSDGVPTHRRKAETGCVSRRSPFVHCTTAMAPLTAATKPNGAPSASSAVSATQSPLVTAKRAPGRVGRGWVSGKDVMGQHTVKNNDRQCWSLGGAHLGLASARRAASRVCDHFVQPDECAAGATRQHSLAPRHQPCSGQSQCFHRSLQQRTQADLHRRQHCQSPAPRSPWAGLQTGGNGLVEFRMGPTGVSVAIVDGSKRCGQVSTPPIY